MEKYRIIEVSRKRGRRECKIQRRVFGIWFNLDWDLDITLFPGLIKYYGNKEYALDELERELPKKSRIVANKVVWEGEYEGR